MNTYYTLLNELHDALSPFDTQYKKMMLDRYAKAYDAIKESEDTYYAESALHQSKGINYDYRDGRNPYTKHIRFVNDVLPRKAQKKLTDDGVSKKDEFLKYAEELADHNISVRNSRVAKKLEDANINEVNGGSIESTNDGFHGLFKVNTDSGEKKVKIQTILAWGSIVAPHYRTLIHIK